jgi:hypothetical protein
MLKTRVMRAGSRPRWSDGLAKRLITLDVMEKAPLRSVTGYIKRHSCSGSQVPEVPQVSDPSSQPSHRSRAQIILRDGEGSTEVHVPHGVIANRGS